jgi:hypothetical protein
MSLCLLIPMLAGMTLFGWVAGMWTHKRAEQWCAACGAQLSCSQCGQAGLHSLESQGTRS